MEKIKCSICGNDAKYETVIGGVYLCDDDEKCWVAATREYFLDGELADGIKDEKDF